MHSEVYSAMSAQIRGEILVKSYLSVVDHVDTLEDDVLGVVTEELEDVLHLCLIQQASQTNAVLTGTGSDYVLW